MSQKAALIFIAGKIRNGQFPRVPGFAYSEEFGKYLYSGAPVPLEEFNAIAERTLDPAEKRFSLSVRIIDVLTPEEKAVEAERVEAEKAEAKRIADEEAAEAAAAKKVEDDRIAAEAAEAKRLTDEAEAETKRLADEEAAEAKPPGKSGKTPSTP